ncbi:MAG TPA: SDR family NAD(P)-dependent oxidoreductase [Arcobacter sp.]|jgi:short-subunit dehydrogenase|nr:SDR family NAD(P)-dependent oxidoreductase [Arcobacter sp.]
METILITGCSTGIGLETALYLQEEGFRVFPTARNQEDVDRLKALSFEAFKLDVTNKDEITSVLDEIITLTGGTLDVVFNNAGFGQPGAIEDISTEALKYQFETNVFGLHEVTLQVLEIMKKQGYGRIIQHSSVVGLVALRIRGAYVASKYAVEGLTDTLRQELSDTNIDVTLLNTGPVTSDFRKNAMKNLEKYVEVEHSRFKESYKRALGGEKSAVPFNLPAIAVAKKVEAIMLAKKVKPRYYITKATYILGFLKRVLSTKQLDKVLLKI